MKSILHIIESNNLFGLADNHNIEIVECVYDKITPLTNVSILSSRIKWQESLTAKEKSFFILKSNVYIISKILIFFTAKSMKNGSIFLLSTKIFFILSVDKLRYDEKLQVINVRKDGELKVYNYNFSQIQTGYEQIEQAEFRRGKSRFYLGKKNGMWGMFRIKRQPKHEPEIISTLEPIYYNSEEALLAFKNSKHNTVRKHKRTKNATTEESKENIN